MCIHKNINTHTLTTPTTIPTHTEASLKLKTIPPVQQVDDLRQPVGVLLQSDPRVGVVTGADPGEEVRQVLPLALNQCPSLVPLEALT